MPATRRSQRLTVAAATPAPTATVEPKKPAAKATAKKAPPKKAAPKKTSSPAAKRSGAPKKPASKATAKKKALPRKIASKKKITPAAKGSGNDTPKKQKRAGLKSVVDTSAPLGVVDPESKIRGSIENLDGEPCDVMLALVDPSKNSDKFLVLQLIRKTCGAFAVYTRWGRTGTAGQALEQEFDDLEAAATSFEDKFKKKTGLKWKDRAEPTKSNKYCFVAQNFTHKQAGFSGALWRYWVDDRIDGKTTGWYDYSDTGSRQAERLYQEYTSNTHSLSQRYVASGAWTYNINLIQMIQTNVTHPNRTSRHIRRCPAGVKTNHDNDPPVPLVASAVLSSPLTPVAAVSAATVTPTEKPTSKPSSSHPVDPDISIHGQSVHGFNVVEGEDGNWYDIILNQCNIAGNNNKYYRLQMLQEQACGRQFFVFLKWGRVGESAKKSASTWLGPFNSVEDAHRSFAKKYRDKSGNALDADPFVPKKNKYVPVEIDNDVEVDGKPQACDGQTQCAPSLLHPKTKDLVEVLFSEDMRNAALSTFNIDLKKLPLGVPSEQQIQHGIEVLGEIEQKLDGEDVDDSFMDLSSRFYTTIPHSFGRSRPPVIDTSESLQQRYDMCNILLDIYSTSETVRKIEKESYSAKQAPCPADLHYKSLKADVTPIDKKTADYKMIQKYFELTKSSYSDSALLDVFAVNRHSEAARFQKFNKIDNRRLLWHGTNVAVVAPILTSGLRIMPHSGGRVGAGVYLAGMQEKSAQYTSGYGAKFACMFLCEAPLGKQHLVTSDGPHASGLKEAPAGFDSVHAMGTMAPPKWGSINIGGKGVQIPQSKATETKVQSSFGHDEFLVYDEAQVCIRYMLTIKL